MYEKPIEVVASVCEHRSAELVYVNLPNGKKILAHLAKGFECDCMALELGQEVELEMTTYDFEKGRIVKVR